jgi:hypothetical protein
VQAALDCSTQQPGSPNTYEYYGLPTWTCLLKYVSVGKCTIYREYALFLRNYRILVKAWIWIVFEGL